MKKDIDKINEEMKGYASEALMLINQFMNGDMSDENEQKIEELLNNASKCREEIKMIKDNSDKRKNDIASIDEVDDNVIDETDFFEEELNDLRDEIGWDVDDKTIWEEYLSRQE